MSIEETAIQRLYQATDLVMQTRTSLLIVSWVHPHRERAERLIALETALLVEITSLRQWIARVAAREEEHR